MGDPFKPSWLSTALTIGLIGAFLLLGNWQLDRAAQKAALQSAFAGAPHLARLPTAPAAERYSRVRLHGRFDRERHLLLDNQVYRTRAGVHVLTPFYLHDGRTLLVDRGWIPLAPDRRVPEDIPTPAGDTAISGILDLPYRPGKILGAPDRPAPDQWPQLVTYPDLGAIANALGEQLYPLIVLLGGDHPAGFEGRDWKPVHTSAAKHQARAMQWFTFAAAAAVWWAFAGFRRGTRK